MSVIDKLEKALAASKKKWNLPEHRKGFPTVKVTEATAEAILAELELPLADKPCSTCGGSGKVKQTCEECGKLSDEDCFSVCRFKPCPKCGGKENKDE